MGVQLLEQFSHKRVDRKDRFWDDLDRDLGSIKLMSMAFQGKNNSEAYLEWKRKWN
jgi:hypothetical protein